MRKEIHVPLNFRKGKIQLCLYRIKNMAKISKNLKKIRNEKLYTQEDLAEKIHVTRQTISNWENDKCQPDLESLKLIAEVFGVSIEALIYGEKSNVGTEPPAIESHSVSKMRVILSIVGSIFIGVGLVLIFSYFWQVFPIFFKTVCSVAPLILGDAFAVFVFLKKKDNLIWRESGGILWCIGAVATTALVNTLYDIHGGYELCLLVDIILCAPVLFLLDAVAPLIPFYYMIIHWSYLSGNYVIGMLLFAVPLVYTLILRKNERFDRYPFALKTFFTALTAYITVFLLGNRLGLFFMMPYLCLAYTVSGRENSYSKPIRVLSGICLAALSAYHSMLALKITTEFEQDPRLNIKLSLILATLCAAAIFGFSAYIDRDNLADDIFNRIHFIITACSFAACVAFAAINAVFTAGALYIAVSVYGIFIIVKGVYEKKASVSNLGFALCFFQIVTLLSLCEANELIIGLVFMVFGVSLIGINVGLGLAKKHSNELAETEETDDD